MVTREWPPVSVPVWLTVAKDMPSEHRDALL